MSEKSLHLEKCETVIGEYNQHYCYCVFSLILVLFCFFFLTLLGSEGIVCSHHLRSLLGLNISKTYCVIVVCWEFVVVIFFLLKNCVDLFFGSVLVLEFI